MRAVKLSIVSLRVSERSTGARVRACARLPAILQNAFLQRGRGGPAVRRTAVRSAAVGGPALWQRRALGAPQAAARKVLARERLRGAPVRWRRGAARILAQHLARGPLG